MINGYFQIRVMANGRYADCWQAVTDGVVTGHVDDAGAPVELPEPHESYCLTGQLHFAPGVLTNPDGGPNPAPLFDAQSEGG